MTYTKLYGAVKLFKYEYLPSILEILKAMVHDVLCIYKYNIEAMFYDYNVRCNYIFMVALTRLLPVFAVHLSPGIVSHC